MSEKKEDHPDSITSIFSQMVDDEADREIEKMKAMLRDAALDTPQIEKGLSKDELITRVDAYLESALAKRVVTGIDVNSFTVSETGECLVNFTIYPGSAFYPIALAQQQKQEEKMR